MPVQFQSSVLIVTPWRSNTPTIVGCGTVSANVQYSRRVGDTLEVKGIFTSGTSTATQLRINCCFLSDGDVTVDTSKSNASGLCGNSAVGVAAATYYTVLIPSANQVYVNIGAASAGTNPLAAINGSAVISSGQALAYNFTVPIVGWGA